MPIEIPNNQSAPVYFPKENYKIARYFDLVKFISLIQTQKVFFSRLDKFEDKYEGTVTELTKQEYTNWYRNFAKHKLEDLIKNNLDDYVENEMLNENDARENFKKLVCVSCWNQYSSESYALWKIYSDLSKGIMITTNVNRLIEAFNNTKEKIQLSEIKYIDYKTERMPLGNMNYPLIHKNIHYEYEKEIRLIHTVNFTSGLKYDWSKEEIEFGKYLNISLEHLIEEIVISPYAPKWFFDLVYNLCLKYNIKKEIRYSDLK